MKLSSFQEHFVVVTTHLELTYNIRLIKGLQLLIIFILD